mmetsp:Transcript_82266/g.100926  ORF Transcript_82266/g.100926 Transcript_82266/m.100926 type:complete len:443 (+) Transcript_82266:71-1399(+)
MSTKAQSYFLPANDESKNCEENYTTEQKIKKFAITNRGKFMELSKVVGVTSMKSNDTTAIVLRVSKDFKEWETTPEWIKKAENTPKISDKYIKGYYNAINKETGKALTIDNETVIIICQSEEADINIESLKDAINNIGPTLKYPYYNYTKAQEYFLEFVSSGNDNNTGNDINKQIKKISNELRSKLMGLSGINGITVSQFKDVTQQLCIIAKIGKQYKKFENIPTFLKKCDTDIKFNDINVKDYYYILNDTGDDILTVDNKQVLLVIKYYPLDIPSLKPATNNIGSTNKSDYKNYTKPAGYFIDFDDNNDESKKPDTLNSKIKSISIDMRQEIRNLSGIIGVKTQICKDVGNAVIVARVNKTWKPWDTLPKILNKPENTPKTDDTNVKNWYILCNKDGKKFDIDGKPVLLCTYLENTEIDSLKSPQNKINPSKKSAYAKQGQ